MKRTLISVAFLALVTFGAQAAKLDDGQLVRLQAAMQTHIDMSSINGAMLRFDANTGQVGEMFATKAHPKIMAMGKHFVMCADFVDAQGKPLMGNFYMAQDGDKFVVYHTTWGDDPALMKMMNEGTLSMAN